MLAVNDLASHVGMEAACRALAFNPGYVYRDRARGRGVFTRHPIAVRPRAARNAEVGGQSMAGGPARRRTGGPICQARHAAPKLGRNIRLVTRNKVVIAK